MENNCGFGGSAARPSSSGRKPTGKTWSRSPSAPDCCLGHQCPTQLPRVAKGAETDTPDSALEGELGVLEHLYPSQRNLQKNLLQLSSKRKHYVWSNQILSYSKKSSQISMADPGQCEDVDAAVAPAGCVSLPWELGLSAELPELDTAMQLWTTEGHMCKCPQVQPLGRHWLTKHKE